MVILFISVMKMFQIFECEFLEGFLFNTGQKKTTPEVFTNYCTPQMVCKESSKAALLRVIHK